MNNETTFEEYIKNLVKRGFDLSIEYRAMDNRLWIRVRKDGAFFIGYIDNPGDYLTFKIVVWNTIENLVNKVEKLLKQKGEKSMTREVNRIRGVMLIGRNLERHSRC